MVIDEISQYDGALFDSTNSTFHAAREAQDRLGCACLGGHWVHPFAMMRVVILAGDFAQLAYPNSTPLCNWPTMFRRMPAPKHSNKQLEELCGTEGRRRSKNDTHVDRLRALNGFAAHEVVPMSVPGPADDPRTLWRGNRDPRRWLAPGGGTALGAPIATTIHVSGLIRSKWAHLTESSSGGNRIVHCPAVNDLFFRVPMKHSSGCK